MKNKSAIRDVTWMEEKCGDLRYKIKLLKKYKANSIGLKNNGKCTIRIMRTNHWEHVAFE